MSDPDKEMAQAVRTLLFSVTGDRQAIRRRKAAWVMGAFVACILVMALGLWQGRLGWGGALLVVPSVVLGFQFHAYVFRRWMETGFQSICHDMIETGMVLAADQVESHRPTCPNLQIAAKDLRSTVRHLRRDRAAPAHMHTKDKPCTSDCPMWQPKYTQELGLN